MTACRLYAVTYFLEVPAAGRTVQTPRLMRQVNGLTAVPVADNIINLQFSYDVINSVDGTMSANQANPVGAGLSPALIQKVNIWVMGQGLTSGGNHDQSMYLASSVSARNLSFCNSYSTLLPFANDGRFRVRFLRSLTLRGKTWGRVNEIREGLRSSRRFC